MMILRNQWNINANVWIRIDRILAFNYQNEIVAHTTKLQARFRIKLFLQSKANPIFTLSFLSLCLNYTYKYILIVETSCSVVSLIYEKCWQYGFYQPHNFLIKLAWSLRHLCTINSLFFLFLSLLIFSDYSFSWNIYTGICKIKTRVFSFLIFYPFGASLRFRRYNIEN